MNLKVRSNYLSAAWVIDTLAYSIVYPFIPIYLHEERGIPIDKVGIIFPLMGIAIILNSALAGFLTDRMGRCRIMQFGQYLRTAVFITLALMALYEAPFWLFAVMLMVNAGTGTFFEVAADSYLSDMTTLAQRPAVYSKIRIGINTGWAVGPMLGAFLARTPFSLMFGMTGLLCLCGAIFTGITCKELRGRAPGDQSLSPSDGGTDPSGIAGEVEPLPMADANTSWTLRTLLKDRTMIRLLVSSFFLYLMTSQLYSIMSVYSTGVVGVSKNTLGFIYSLNGFTIIIFQLLITRYFDRRKVRQLVRLAGGTLLYATGFFSLAFATNGWHLAAGVFVLTQGEIMVQPALYTLLTKLSPPDGMGRSIAALGLIRGIGYAIGPWFGTQVFSSYSTQPVMLWGILSSFAVIAGIGFVTLRRDARAAKLA